MNSVYLPIEIWAYHTPFIVNDSMLSLSSSCKEWRNIFFAELVIRKLNSTKKHFKIGDIHHLQNLLSPSLLKRVTQLNLSEDNILERVCDKVLSWLSSCQTPALPQIIATFPHLHSISFCGSYDEKEICASLFQLSHCKFLDLRDCLPFTAETLADLRTHCIEHRIEVILPLQSISTPPSIHLPRLTEEEIFLSAL